MSEIIWVAEIGSMHKGDKSLAYELIRQAAEAGATIAKFQFGWPAEDKLRCVDSWATDLSAWCDSFGIELMASIWSPIGLEVARGVNMKRYKIAHQKKDETELVKSIMSDGKQVFVSGADMGTPVWVSESYPTYPADLNMPKIFGFPWYGYSDHSHGIAPCLLAVARGALYVEKHFCLDKTDLVVRDTPFSATPAEFSEMVRLGNGLRRLLDAQA